MELTVLAASAATLVWPLVRGALREGADAAADAGGEIVRTEASGVARRLWDRLRGGHKAIEAAAEENAPDALEELARQIGRLLERDEGLAAEVAALVEEAQEAGQVVEGHALVERVRAQRDIWAEGASATIRDAEAGQDAVARAHGAPERPKA